jgi:hypothetical protein
MTIIDLKTRDDLEDALYLYRLGGSLILDHAKCDPDLFKELTDKIEEMNRNAPPRKSALVSP